MSPHKRKLKHQQQRERGRARASARKAAAASTAELVRQDVRSILAPARAGSAFLLAAGLEDAASKK